MEFIGYRDWNELPASANQLLQYSARDSIFFSLAWLENLKDSLQHDKQSMLLASVVEGDQVLAILPLKTQDGKHLTGLTHFYSSLLSVMMVPENQQSIVKCLAKGLDGMTIESLQLDPVAENDDVIEQLRLALESMGYQSHRRFRFYNWVHQLQGQSFDRYMASRPSRVKNTISRKQRKLAREHDYDIRLYTSQDLGQGLADYNSVYRASWKANEQHEAFVENVVKSLAVEGWLRLAVLYIGSQPVAAQLWFVVHKRASIFKLVYDQSWKQYSPGTILTGYLMQYVIENDDVEEIDFLTGNDAYKQDWMSQRRQRFSWSFFKPRRPSSRAERIIKPIKSLLLTQG